MANVGSPFMNSCILTAVGVVVVMINSSVISKIGRRRVFLMTGLSICGVTQLIIAAVYHVNPGTTSTGKVSLSFFRGICELLTDLSKAIVGLSVIYIIGYNGMIAAYAWLSGGEIPSQRLRSYTFGIASAVAFAGAWLTTFTAPYFINPDSLNWGPEYGKTSIFTSLYSNPILTSYVGWIWGPSCFITAAWVYFYLPEIKNRTLEEIDEMFEARLPARKFRKYVCTGRVAAGPDDKIESRDSDKDEVVHHEIVGAEKSG